MKAAPHAPRQSHGSRRGFPFRLSAKHIPLLATALVCLGLYIAAASRYDNFASLQVFVNLLTDNAFLGIAAVGLTFVILTGGIDLSVGAVIGATSIAVAVLVERKGVHPAVVVPLAVATGALFGAAMGWIIHYCKLPAFLVTLAGMFMARGIGYLVSLESIALAHPFYGKVAGYSFPLGEETSVTLVPLIYLGIFGIGLVLAHSTRFGRNVYAIGGSEDASSLMGLPVGPTKIAVYALSGFCSALAGVVFTLYGSSGNANAATTLELDAIAAVVVGGTLLSGGVGYLAGTFLGVLIFGIIQTAIMFEGTLNSWWTKIAIATLLLAFILLQKAVTRSTAVRVAA